MGRRSGKGRWRRLVFPLMIGGLLLGVVLFSALLSVSGSSPAAALDRADRGNMLSHDLTAPLKAIATAPAYVSARLAMLATAFDSSASPRRHKVSRMAIINVTNSAELTRALASASSGDTVYMAGGDYADTLIRNVNIAGQVTITSAPGGAPAVIHGLRVNDSSGLKFTGIEVDTTQMTRKFGLEVNSSHDVVFDKMNVHGSLDSDPTNDNHGVVIRGSTNVAFTNSEIHQVMSGIAFLDTNDGLTLSGNNIHDISADGIHGGGASHLVIADNRIQNFFPTDAYHSDAIQLWTTNTTTPATDISITGNQILRGNGTGWMQGIFVTDQVGFGYKNVTISDNFLAGTSYNAITLHNTATGTVSDNVVVSFADFQAGIRLKNVTNATVDDNVAGKLVFVEGNTVLSNVNNRIMGAVTDGGTSALMNWVNSHEPTSNGEVLKPMAIDGPLTGKDIVPTVTGSAGADVLHAVRGVSSQVDGGAGDDRLYGEVGEHSLSGGTGSDTYIVYDEKNAVIEKAGQGMDLVYSYVDFGLGANVEDLYLMGDAASGRGNDLANAITGNESDNYLYGMDGNDKLGGKGGDDDLWGGNGNDTLQGGDGADMLFGEAGDDRLLGDNGNDIVSGGLGNDNIYGGAGNDTLAGDAGNDVLMGDDGNDILTGGDGNDALYGGAGSDTLTGGAGSDTFYLRSIDLVGSLADSLDVITDFSSRDKDKISLGYIDAKTATSARDKFSFIGTSAFSRKAGQLRCEITGGNAFVYGDTNGDGMADFKLCVQGVTSLAASDFVL